MKIILVRPCIPVRWLITPPLGLGYIAAAAKKVGHECIIYDAWLKNETPLQAALGLSFQEAEFIGVQIFSNTVAWTREFLGYIRRPGLATKLIVGGPYVTVVGDKAREEVGADIGIQGEFDHSLDIMLPRIIEQHIPCTFQQNLSNVNTIPIPDWNAIPLPLYWPYLYQVSTPTKGKRIGVIQRSRGCPFHCTFCAAGATMGHTVRYRDDDNVIEEIEYLRNRWGINELWLQDDNAIVNYEKGLKLFAQLEPLKLHIRLPLGIRWENIDDKMARAMKDAGVYFTGIGIESGNPRVLKRIKKSAQPDKLKNAIRILAEHNIITIGFFIFGLPTETRTEMEDTIRWALSTKLHHAQFGIFIPYPGSEDYDKRSLLTQDKLVKIQRNATLRFYLRPRIIWNFIKYFKWSQLLAMWRHPWCVAWRKIT